MVKLTPEDIRVITIGFCLDLIMGDHVNVIRHMARTLEDCRANSPLTDSLMEAARADKEVAGAHAVKEVASAPAGKEEVAGAPAGKEVAGKEVDDDTREHYAIMLSILRK